MVPIELTRLKVLLGIPKDDTTQDEVLTVIKETAQLAICQYIGVTPLNYPVMELDWIADEISTARFSLLNSEGLKTETTDISRFDYKDDIFAQWLPYLDKYMLRNSDSTTGARLRLL